MFRKHTHRLVILIILLPSSFLRFYNLMHDAPYFFNPDERNMASAITRFSLPNHPTELTVCITSELFLPIFNFQFSIFNQISNYKFQNSNCNLNPHFFAYGQFPLYLSFISDQLTKPITSFFLREPITNNQPLIITFPSAIFWLRFWSALSSTFTVLVVFLISRKLFTFNSRPELVEWVSLFTAAAAAFTPGLIQSAHFGTTESLLTFFFMASIYVAVRYLSNLGHLRFILLTSITIGLSLGSKLTGLFFFIPPAVSLIIRIIELFSKKMKVSKRSKLLLGYWLIGLLVIIGSILVSILSSPYNLVEWNNFLSAVFGYEADVATGKFPAFYTRQFIGTTPILFQIEKIFPHQLGWPIFILGLISLLFISVQLIVFLFNSFRMLAKRLELKAKKQSEKFKAFNFSAKLFVLSFSFLVYFIPNSFLFVKWTRFMTPLLPFFAVFAGWFIVRVCGHLSHLTHWSNWKLGYWVIGLLVFISLLPGLAFFSIYTREDSRVTASRWIYENIPDGSYILSETANVVDIPLGLPTTNVTKNYTVISFDFYHLHENPQLMEDLYRQLTKAEYIFIPSRRIFANHLPYPDQFPQLTRYYELLFSGELGFEKVAQIDSYPQFSIFNFQFLFPDEHAEETATVFDHPVIRIYKKVRQLGINDYALLFADEKTSP